MRSSFLLDAFAMLDVRLSAGHVRPRGPRAPLPWPEMETPRRYQSNSISIYQVDIYDAAVSINNCCALCTLLFTRHYVISNRDKIYHISLYTAY